MRRQQRLLGVLVLAIVLMVMKYMYGTSSTHSDENTLQSAKDMSADFHRNQFLTQTFIKTTNCTNNSLDLVHFCIAAGQKGVMLELSVLLKSMFLHSSRSDLFLHFLVDVETEKDIHSFMSDIPGLQTNIKYEIKLIDIDFVIKEATKMKVLINHHSGVFGMSKLFFYNLWENLERCIILDVDLIFALDPALLWAEFNKMDNQSAIMMHVDKQASFCNSGVMLQRYDLMRKLNFDKIYANGVAQYCKRSEEDIEMYNCGNHGDQNLYHQVYMQFPTLYMQIDSSWNLELCHDFDGFDFSTGQGRGGSKLFFGIAHFNCLPDDDSYAEFQKKAKYDHLKLYVKKIQDLNSSDFTEGKCLIQHV